MDPFGMSAWLIFEGAAMLVRIVAEVVSPTMPATPPPAIEECAEGTAYDPISMLCEPAE